MAMLSSTGGIVRSGTALLRRYPAVSQASFARSFSTTRVHCLPPSFFVPHGRPSISARTTSGPLSPGPSPQSSPVLKALQSRSKWSFARHGMLSSNFSTKHPWIAVILRIILGSALGVITVVAGVLIHDAFTYNRRKGMAEPAPSPPLSLSPRRGGPKNLPIIESHIDDDDEVRQAMKGKPRIVILGGGWGAVGILKTLPTDYYNVTVIAPENYFCFTPLLPSACVGTVEPRSLVEPLRHLIHRVHGHYLAGRAVDMDMNERLVEVEIPNPDGSGSIHAYVPYDKVIVAVGSRSNDHGVKGLENCFQLKTIPDAQAIRRRIMANLEVASLPTTSPEERKRLLSFVVCGGGPTGVEMAAEVADMLEEDVLDYYPGILQSDITVSIIQSRDHILNTYSEKISDFAEKRFARSAVKIHTNARVSQVTPESVIITVKGEDGKTTTHEIPSGFTLWSTGIAMQPFTKRMVEKLPNQYHSKAVMVDGYLHVEGAPPGTVYAIGDASTIHLNMLDDLLKLWEQFDQNHDGKLDYDEWKQMAKYLRKKYTLTSVNLEKIREVFQEYDTDGDNALRMNEVAAMFMKMSKKVTSLPATAQVAAQQGEYLGKMFSKIAKDDVMQAKERKYLADGSTDYDDLIYFPPFKYRHLGSLAYIGNSAVFDYYGFSVVGGLLGMYAWRSVYWGEQTSMRARFMLLLDWVKRGLFGRDLSKF